MIPPCTPTPDHAGRCPRVGDAEDAHDDSEEGGFDLARSLAVALVMRSVRSRKGRAWLLAECRRRRGILLERGLLRPPFRHESMAKEDPLVDRKGRVLFDSLASINYCMDSSSTMDTHRLGLVNMIVNSLYGSQLDPFPHESSANKIEGGDPHRVVSEDS